MCVLKLENLEAKYSSCSKCIFKNVNLEIFSGDFILLTGASGSGKSTLLKAVAGLLLKDDCVNGNIVYFDGDTAISLTEKTAHERAKLIGTVLQNADEQIIFERVEDELAFPLENLGMEAKHIQPTIEKYANFMELDYESKTAKLSGGQKQRLITASTLGMNQKIIFFDEPLANLDKKASVKLLKTLKSLCTSSGYSIVFIEHRLDLAGDYANRLLLLENENLSEHESLQDIKIKLNKQVDEISNAMMTLESKETPEPIFELTDVCFSIDKKQILNNFNYTFNKGGKYLILGDNGSGKTTLLNLLSGIYKPTKGKVKSYVKTKKIFQAVGMVMQNPNYQLFMPSVRAEIEYQAKSKDNMDKLIKTMGLTHLLDRHPHSLSEGQKRRVGLAAILSMEPEVLILDEPSVGQDIMNIKRMINGIVALSLIKNITLIIVSHDTRFDFFENCHVINL